MYTGVYKFIYFLFPAFFMIVFLVSCAQPPNITGKWQEPGKTSSIEFRQDGTFTATDEMGMVVNGTYTLQSNDNIRLEIKHPNTPVERIIANFAMQDDELRLTLDKDNEVLSYKKINGSIYK